MRKTVIFDMDGTLLDTLEDLYLSANAALESCGFPKRSMEDVRQSVGNGVRNLMRNLTPDKDLNPRFEECFLTFKNYYALHLNDHTKPYDGIMELLEQLSKLGYSMAIVSNKTDPEVKKLTRQMFGSYISVAIGESEGIKRKPNPDTVYEAMRQLKADSDSCIYVGDSEVDLLTAKNSGIPCIAVSWGFRGRRALEKVGAQRIADTPEELFWYLKA